MDVDHGREPGYAELLAALLALRPDPATARFDALVAELVAVGRLDPAGARELRWWQRESVRAVGDYVADTAPALLATLEAARERAQRSADVAATAWDRANVPADPGTDEQQEHDEAQGEQTRGDEAQAPGGGRPDLGTAGGPVASSPDPGGRTAPSIVVDLRSTAASPGTTGSPEAAAEPAADPALRSPSAAPHPTTGAAAPPTALSRTALASPRARLLLRAPMLSDPTRTS